MEGFFCFDDLHAEVSLPFRRRQCVQVHVAITCHEVKAVASGEEKPLNGVIITPEREVDKGLPFAVLGRVLTPTFEGECDFNILEEEVIWRPADCDLVAAALAQSFRGWNGWDGMDLRDLNDDVARFSVASYLTRLAKALGVSRFYRTSGAEVLY